MPTLADNFKSGDPAEGPMELPPHIGQQIISDISQITNQPNWYELGNGKDAPIQLTKPPTKEQALFLAGRWVVFWNNGKLMRKQLPGRMLDVRKEVPVSRTPMPLG